MRKLKSQSSFDEPRRQVAPTLIGNPAASTLSQTPISLEDCADGGVGVGLGFSDVLAGEGGFFEDEDGEVLVVFVDEGGAG